MKAKLKFFLEHQFFGVCAYWGDKLNMPVKNIRLFFIYLSFITAFSPVLIYLAMAFILRLRLYINNRRNPVWDI